MQRVCHINVIELYYIYSTVQHLSFDLGRHGYSEDIGGLKWDVDSQRSQMNTF